MMSFEASYFSEEQLKNLKDIGNEMFNDEQDPCSSAYIRKLERPKMSLIKTLLLYIILSAAVITAIIVLLDYFNLSKTNIAIIADTILMAYILLGAK